MLNMKYFNKKVIFNGIKFDSKKESEYYLKLKEDEEKGLIKDLKLQPEFLLIDSFRDKNGKLERKCVYTADFEYINRSSEELYVIEIKSKYTAKLVDYILRRKFFKSKYPEINFIEVIC